MVDKINLPCLKNLEAIKAYEAAQVIGNPDDQGDEDDIHTVIEEKNNANNQIPQAEENILNQDVPPLPSPLHSPRNSKGSSKSVKLEGQSYQVRK